MAGKARQAIGAALATFGGILCVIALVALVWAGMLFMRLADRGYQFEQDAGEVAAFVAAVGGALLLVGAFFASVGAGLYVSGRASAALPAGDDLARA